MGRYGRHPDPDRMVRVTSVVVVFVFSNPGSSNRVVTITIVGTVWVTGPRVLGRVDGPGNDGKGHVLLRWTYGFLVGVKWVIMGTVADGVDRDNSRFRTG